MYRRTFILFVFTLMSFLLACTETTTTSSHESCSYSISVDVSNGTEQVETEFIMTLAYGTGDLGFTADGIWATYDLVDNLDDLPSIDQSATMELTRHNGATVGQVDVYDSDGVLLMTWNSWDERSTLDAGQYFIVISSNKTESTCNISGKCVFVLNVL